MEGVKANELRMGNWVMVGRTPTQIEGIDEQGINSSTSGGYYPGDVEVDYEAYFKGQSFWSNYHEPMPIPLTPEILLACGFEEYDEVNHRYLFDGFYYYDDCLWFQTSQIEIKTLHELQNLYFALTANEIIYNPQTIIK